MSSGKDMSHLFSGIGKNILPLLRLVNQEEFSGGFETSSLHPFAGVGLFVEVLNDILVVFLDCFGVVELPSAIRQVKPVIGVFGVGDRFDCGE